MPIFYFHPQNKLAKRMAEMTGVKGMMYTNRGELDFKLQGLLVELGEDVWSTFHTILGSLAGPINGHIPLDPDIEIDRNTLKLCHSSKTPWSFVKIINGPRMSCVVGYCSTPASSPYAMGTAEMAQKGILNVSHMPVRS